MSVSNVGILPLINNSWLVDLSINEQTGKYEIAAAFEINPNAQETYKKNHKGTKVYTDVCSADYGKIKKNSAK